MTIAAYFGAKQALDEALDEKGMLKPAADIAAFHRLRKSLGLEEAETEAQLLRHPLFKTRSKDRRQAVKKAVFANRLRMTRNELAVAFFTYVIALTSIYATIVLILFSFGWVALSFYYMSVSFSRKN